MPEIEEATRFRSWGTFLVKKDKENYKEFNAIWADPGVFNIFSIPLLKGNIQTVLTEPNTMVISQSAARKYFGNADPLNQTLILEWKYVIYRYRHIQGYTPQVTFSF